MMKLNELAKKDIDLWVEAVSNIDDDPVLFKAVIDEATDDEIRTWLEYDRCPGELERPINVVCEKYGVEFNENGTIACRSR